MTPLVIATSSTAGCVAGAGTILRSINTILTGSVPPAENEALTATFAVLVPDSHKSYPKKTTRSWSKPTAGSVGTHCDVRYTDFPIPVYSPPSIFA